MCKIKMYRHEELYLILTKTGKMFWEAAKNYDFKNIGKNNNIENTVQILTMLSLRLRELCESILSCREPYGVAILYRAFIEHFLKHTYFFIYCTKKDDEAAKEYTSVTHIMYEQLKKAQKAIWPDNLGNRNPSSEFKQIRKDANRTAEQFTFNEISKKTLELISEYYSEDDDKMFEKGLRNMLVQYSISSSYVHAGPAAVLNPETLLRTNIDMSAKLFAIIAFKHTIQLLSSYPSEYQSELKLLAKEIHKNAENGLTIYEKNYVP